MMAIPNRARLNERTLLNHPGFHGDEYVYIYVEDTSERTLETTVLRGRLWCCPHNFEPRMILEIGDGDDIVRIGFDIDIEAGRANSLHKLDTLGGAVSLLRPHWLPNSTTTTDASSSCRAAA